MYSVVIPCAGKGTRTKLSLNKLLYKVDGLHLIEYTISKFMYDPDFTEIILVVSKNEMEKFEMFTSNKIKLVEGGKMRQDSVYNGVKQATNEIVFVHDGARPLLSQEIIGKCKGAMNYNDSCVVGYPITDSIKEIEDGVVTTITRKNKYVVQTPQCATKSMLLNVYSRAKHDGFYGTDEVSLIEKYTNASINVVRGSKMNIKITYKEDFEIFDKLRK